MPDLTPIFEEFIETRQRLRSWLEQMTAGLDEGRFKLCMEGSEHPVSGLRAQFATVFAMKIAWQTSIWEEWPESLRKACIVFVKSFQREDGNFYDPWLADSLKISWKRYVLALTGRVPWPERLSKHRRNTLRAETRQSLSSLLMVGATPDYPLPVEVKLPDDVDGYFDAFNWADPWGAASHISHQILFLTANKKFFGMDKHYDEIVRRLSERLDGIRDPETGSWFEGTPEQDTKVNGAMKIFSGVEWLDDRTYPDCSELIDFVLKRPFLHDGCGFLNRLFVVYHCLRGVPNGYRAEEVRELARRSFRAVKRFRKPDGAYSFYNDRAQGSYYGVKVSRSLPEGDLHGTVMMTWAMGLIAELLKLERSIIGNWRPLKP